MLGNRLKMFILLIFIALPGFSVSFINGEIGGGFNGNPVSVEYYYSPSATDIVEIGFSTNAIVSFSDAVQLAENEISMNVTPGTFYGTLGDVYIYWKIFSPVPMKIKLSASDLSLETDGQISYINVENLKTECNTSTGSESSQNGTAIDVSREENLTSGSSLSGTVLEYSTGTFGKNCVGSQKISIRTEDFLNVDYVSGIYSGELKVEIVS